MNMKRLPISYAMIVLVGLMLSCFLGSYYGTRGRQPRVSVVPHGWYLMNSPWDASTEVCKADPYSCDGIDKRFPLDRWEMNGAFDTAEACEQRNAELANKAAADFNAAHWNFTKKLTQAEADRLLIQDIHMRSDCVAAGDPRLISTKE
jgi:hypothetical protein